MTVLLRCTVILLLSLSGWASGICFAEASRGIITLGLLNDHFPIESSYETLKDIRNPAFGFVHKSFGSNTKNVAKLIDMLLNSSGSSARTVTVLAYVDCGPCRSPRRPKGLFKVIEPTASIGKLNRLLEARNTHALTRINKEIEHVVSYMPRVSGVNYIIYPGLEDNFTNRAVAVINSLIKQMISNRDDITLSRNPFHFRPSKTKVEAHSYSFKVLSQLKRGDVITGDGDNICFPHERCKGRSISYMQKFLRHAKSRGVHVLLWRPEMQGLPRGTPGYKTILTPPGHRHYSIPGIPYLKKLLTGD